MDFQHYCNSGYRPTWLSYFINNTAVRRTVVGMFADYLTMALEATRCPAFFYVVDVGKKYNGNGIGGVAQINCETYFPPQPITYHRAFKVHGVSFNSKDARIKPKVSRWIRAWLLSNLIINILIIYILLSFRRKFLSSIDTIFLAHKCMCFTSYLIKNIINCEKNLIRDTFLILLIIEYKKIVTANACLFNKHIINAVFALVTEIPTALEEPWECWLGGCRDGRRDILSGNTKLSSYSRSIFVWKKKYVLPVLKYRKKEMYYYFKLCHINVLFFSILYIYALLLCQQKTYLFPSSHRKSVSFN